MEKNPVEPTDPTQQTTDHMIDHLSVNGKHILLIGTAHVSKQSAELVKETIQAERPDTVCVELCQTRLTSLKDVDRWRNMDIIKIIKEKKALLLFINLLLASFQKKMADKFGIKPGQEMINAIKAAKEVDAALIPSDREIQITLNRVWRAMGLWEKLKLMGALVFSFGASDEIEEEDIENMKQEDILQTLLKDVKKSHPIIEKTLIDERDQFLAEKIRTAPGEKIIAVVGAAHAPGIKRYLAGNQTIDIDELNQIPPTGKLGGFLKWAIPAAILLLFVMGFAMKGKSAGTEMIWIWVAANGIFAGLGAALALAHPFTIISSILAAPLTSLNPMIAAGWVSGLVEAFARKPKVKDLESIPEDIVTMKGFWKNNVTRILLVVVFTNIGSSIGTFVAVPLMLKLIN
ncbi:MAG: TraB/GumN family protein [Pseudomonadota bacterium]